MERAFLNPAGDWQLWRQDDHGNRFLVREHLSREDALALQADFERRGHKQLYWIQRERSDGDCRPDGHAEIDDGAGDPRLDS